MLLHMAPPASERTCQALPDAHNPACCDLPAFDDTMSFLIRFAACVFAVLSMSILAAVAWDDSDQAAAMQAQTQGTVQAADR